MSALYVLCGMPHKQICMCYIDVTMNSIRVQSRKRDIAVIAAIH